MVEETTKSVRIDLNQFKLQLYLKPEVELTLHFDSPSRRFYLSVIAFVVHEMKKRGRITSIPLEEHLDLLALLNQTVGGAAGSSKKECLLPRIYRKWKDALPNIENAPLFKVVGRKKKYDDSVDRVYCFSEGVKDSWANLFEYKGSHEHVRLRFSIDRLGASLDDVVIVFGEYPEKAKGDAWESFITRLQTDHILMELSGIIPEVNNDFKLPNKRSIAVLPFVNMSGDPDQEYFSDGIAEEIITGLSKIHGMFVIARNSSFTYKGKPVRVQQVSTDLGIRYVLEGSVRKAGNRVRITVQLVDAVDGHHLWAERYDRHLEDIFALQDEITMKILTALQMELTEGESARVFAKGTTNFEAYIKFLQAREYVNRGNFILARQNAYEAIELDNNFPAPYVLMAWTHWFDARFEKTESPGDSFKEAYSLSQKALALDDSIPDVHALAGVIHLYQRQHETAIAAGERAVFLGPNHAEAHAIMAHILRFACRFEEAVSMIKKAIRLQPSYHYWYLIELSMGYYWTGRYEEAISVAGKFRKLVENVGLLHCEAIKGYHLMLIMNYMKLGLDKEAREAATELLRLVPAFTLEWDRRYSCYKDSEYLESQHKDLRKAGLK